MQGIEYIFELCEALPRSGPGNNASTRRAFEAIPAISKQPMILDIGCGQGMQTIELARLSGGRIIALDIHQGFLDLLMETAKSEGLEDHIIPRKTSMHEMDFEDETFDIIWSEGALYIMGFEKGLQRCLELLKPRGCLALTELVYLSAQPPMEVIEYLEQEYSAISHVEDKIRKIEKAGFSLIDHFTLPESAWMEDYYHPMQQQLPGLIKKYQGNELALSVFEDFEAEIEFYKKYSQHFGYEFFVMQKD